MSTEPKSIKWRNCKKWINVCSIARRWGVNPQIRAHITLKLKHFHALGALRTGIAQGHAALLPMLHCKIPAGPAAGRCCGAKRAAGIGMEICTIRLNCLLELIHSAIRIGHFPASAIHLRRSLVPATGSSSLLPAVGEIPLAREAKPVSGEGGRGCHRAASSVLRKHMPHGGAPRRERGVACMVAVRRAGSAGRGGWMGGLSALCPRSDRRLRLGSTRAP